GFAGTGAQFLFPQQINPIVDPLILVPRQVILSDTFSIDFTVDALSDLLGFTVANALGTPAPLIPPTSVDAVRADFTKPIGVLEDFTFAPDGFAPDAGLDGTIAIITTYDFTPAVQIAEPTTLVSLAAGLTMLGAQLFRGRRRRTQHAMA